jgi:threonine/homoserine/homoserine lactone efflux protein
LVTPGPTNTLVATAGAQRHRSAIPILTAELLGYLVTISSVRLALLPLMDGHPAVVIAMKIVVILYLAYAATRLWRMHVAPEARNTAVSPGFIFLTTIINPKGLIFGIAVFPRHNPHLWTYFGVFAALVGICGLAWFLLGRGVSSAVGKSAAGIPRVASIAIVIFAGLIAASLVA